MSDIEEQVWGEIGGLAPVDSADATLTRLYAVVARMVTLARERGLDGEFRQRGTVIMSRSSKEDQNRYALMRGAIQQVEANGWTDLALPQRAVLWELNADGKLRLEGDGPPAHLAWINETASRPGGDFKHRDGRVFRLLEADKPAGPDECPFASTYTGTGLPVRMALTGRQRALPWILGLVGGIGFIAVALNLAHLSSSYAQAYDLLMGRQVAHVAPLAERLVLLPCAPDRVPICESDATKDVAGALAQRQGLVTGNGKRCVDLLADAARSLKAAPNTAIVVDQPCVDLVGQAVRYAGQYLVVTSNTMVGGWYQAAVWWAFGWLIPSFGGQHASLTIPLCLMMAGIVSLLIGLGIGVERKPFGALISPENRYSLGLAQVTFWTVLVLTSVVAIAIFNGGLVAEQLRYFAHLAVTSTSPDAVKNGFFPSIPPEIWAVLGITFASPMLSTLLKSLRPKAIEGMPEFAVRGANVAAANAAGRTVLGFQTPLAARPNSDKASIADWFLGEDTNAKDRIDITRLQMVIITVGLIVTYGGAIFATVRDLPLQDILLAIRDTTVLIPSLPVVGATMALMLATSHATYLIAKTAEVTVPRLPPGKPPQ